MTNSDKTLRYYENNAQDFIKNTLDKEMNLAYETFEAYLSKGMSILDAGCGSGRDSLYFKNKGYEITAFDASSKMCAFASTLLQQEVFHLSFEDMDFNNEFDGIWASASLLHVSKMDLPKILVNLARALKPKGILYASFKEGDKEFIKEDRFFNSYSKESITLLIEDSPFNIEEVFLLEDSRPDKKGEMWLNIIICK